MVIWQLAEFPSAMAARGVYSPSHKINTKTCSAFYIFGGLAERTSKSSCALPAWRPGWQGLVCLECLNYLRFFWPIQICSKPAHLGSQPCYGFGLFRLVSEFYNFICSVLKSQLILDQCNKVLQTRCKGFLSIFEDAISCRSVKNVAQVLRLLLLKSKQEWTC